MLNSCNQTRCPLFGKTICEPYFSTDPPVDLLVIGIAPGSDEEEQGKVFVGKSGKLLRPYLFSSKLSFAMTNIVACRPTDSDGKNRNPEKNEIRFCSNRFLNDVIKAKPKVVLLLGEPTIKTFLENDPRIRGKIHIGAIREKVFWEGKLPVLCDYHPSFFVRMGSEAIVQANKCYIPTLMLAESIVNGTYKPTKANIVIFEYEKDVLNFLHELSHTDKLISIDFEYDVSKYNDDKKSLYKQAVKRLCVGIAIDNETGYCIPEDHKDSPFIGRNFPIAKAIKGKHITSHNISAELLCLSRFDNVDPSRVEFEDSFLATYLINPDDLGGRDLKTLALKFTDFGGYEKDLELLYEKLGRSNKDYGEIPLNILARYCAHDALVARIITERQIDELKRRNLYNTYLWLKRKIPLLCNTTHNGIIFDYTVYNKNKQWLSNKIKLLETLINKHPSVQYTYKSLGCNEFNVRSPQHCKKLLFNVLGLEILKKSKKTKEPVVDKEILNIYSTIPIVKSILVCKRLKDLISKYIGPLNTFICEDGRGHPLFNIAGARTGRLSSSNFSIQVIPHTVAMRNMFKADDGFILVSLDLSQIELRILAEFTEDPNLINAFIEGKDIHQETADALGIDRKIAKNVNFGIVYGESAHGLARRLNISNKEAEDFIKKLFSKFPGINTYLNNIKYMLLNFIPISTPFGRVRTFHWTENNFDLVYRQAINYPIQSTASDIMLCIFEEAWNKLGYRRSFDKFGREIYPKDRLFIIPHAIIHDELVSSCREDQLEDICKELVNIAEHIELPFGFKLKVPIIAGIKYAKSWGDMLKK